MHFSQSNFQTPEALQILYSDSLMPLMEDKRPESASIHESSYVDRPCQIGENTSVLHFAHVMGHSIIGDNCVIGHHVTIASGVYLGNNVRVMHNSLLNSGVILEDGVYCGPSVVFVENKRVRADIAKISRISPTVVRVGGKIGPNSTVGSGYVIGSFAFVEANTVVDRNVPDFAVVFGNPLKFVGWQCQCGKMLDLRSEDRAVCKACQRAYEKVSKWRIQQKPEGATDRDTDSGSDPTVCRTQGES